MNLSDVAVPDYSDVIRVRDGERANMSVEVTLRDKAAVVEVVVALTILEAVDGAVVMAVERSVNIDA